MPIALPFHRTHSEDLRRKSFPLHHSSRHKPRRWPLALRFIKGSVHMTIFASVLFHTLFTILVVFVDQKLDINLGVPNSITPALSIVVGLLLVFRNSSSYDRFWTGRQDLSRIVATIRNLARYFILYSSSATDEEREETERVVKVLIGMIYAIKNHLRAVWGAVETNEDPELTALLPPGLTGHEYDALGFPLELAFFVGKFIRDGLRRGDWAPPQSANLTAQLNSIVENYTHMETIVMTPIPVCYQIHQKQVLALYCLFLPFGLVDEWLWLTVPTVALVSFTLYGIEGIGQEIENPFGFDRNDIKMDNICRDVRQEITAALELWKRGKDDHFI